jgi:hypothetical protein
MDRGFHSLRSRTAKADRSLVAVLEAVVARAATDTSRRRILA